jgi:hypothetical protein
MTGIFNQNLKNKFVENFKESVGNTASNYYIAFGKFFNWDDDAIPPTPNSSVQTSHYDVNKEIIFGKRLYPEDIAYIVKKITWTSGTVYDEYTHTDPNLFSKQFYVINSLGRVYKCLSNNYGAESTVEPNLTISRGDFNTADGYKWKYLYTVNSINNKLFTTDDYIPVVPDQTVVASAEDGAIHVVTVDTVGNNYISSNGSIDSTISTTLFKISNTGASSISGAHTASYFYIYAGSGSGALTTISDYVVNNTGKYVYTTSAIFDTDSTSLYKIGPQILFDGDGFGASAISNVDANGSIDTITVISRGRNYTYANVSVVSNSYFGSNATAHTIISPKGGHGSDPAAELGCDILGMSVSTNLLDNFPEWAYYRQISLIYNPIASANLTNYQDTTFNQMLNFGVLSAPTLLNEGEIVQGFNSQATATVAYMNTTSIYVLGDVGQFQPYETLTSLSSGKTVVISTINNKDLKPYSSEVFYFRNIEPISREGVRSEDVKLYFNF